MKLPTDKKERTKVLALIAVGVVAVLYGVVAGVVFPILNQKKAKAERIVTLRETLRKAQMEIRRLIDDRDTDTQIVRGILDAANERKNVLRPRLGNFLLGATETIEQHAKKADVDIGGVAEIGISEIPKPPGRTMDYAFKMYTAQVSLQCGLRALCALLQDIEESNPYLCISGLSITAQPQTPDRHKIVFDVQWPIWTDPAAPAKLEEQIEQAAAFGTNTQEVLRQHATSNATGAVGERAPTNVAPNMPAQENEPQPAEPPAQQETTDRPAAKGT